MVANTMGEMIGQHVSSGQGLTTAEATERLNRYGPNMAPISSGLVGGVLLLILLYLAVVDFLKIKTIQYFHLC